MQLTPPFAAVPGGALLRATPLLWDTSDPGAGRMSMAAAAVCRRLVSYNAVTHRLSLPLMAKPTLLPVYRGIESRWLNMIWAV